MTITAGQLGATQLLALLLAAIPDPHEEGVSVSSFYDTDPGIAAEVKLPSGDRYGVAVQWLGDRETAR